VTPKSTTPASLTWSGATARRMARSALTEPATDRGPADIAGLMCGAHAQVLSAAELSIGRRIAGATREDVQRALWEDRTLVKTFGPPRHGAPAAHRRPADVDRGAVDPAVVGADASRAGPVHPRAGRRAHRRNRQTQRPRRMGRLRLLRIALPVLLGMPISVEVRATCLAVCISFIDLAERLGVTPPGYRPAVRQSLRTTIRHGRLQPR
jgi:hypothetical protein